MTSHDGTTPPRSRVAAGSDAADVDLSHLLPPTDVQLVARMRLDPLDLPPRPTAASLGTVLGRGAARACFGAVDAVRRRRPL